VQALAASFCHSDVIMYSGQDKKRLGFMNRSVKQYDMQLNKQLKAFITLRRWKSILLSMRSKAVPTLPCTCKFRTGGSVPNNAVFNWSPYTNVNVADEACKRC